MEQSNDIQAWVIWTHVIIMFCCGILGGIANYLLANPTKEWIRYDAVKSMFLGVAAAATVPLFLMMVKSNLIQDTATQKELFFVFAGFCLIAAIFSAKFLQSVADRVMKDLEEVKKSGKENEEKLDAIVAQNSDDHDIDAPSPTILAMAADPEASKVLQALKNEQYTFRTLEGISKETEGNEMKIKSVLSQLEGVGYTSKLKRSDGKVLWSLTPKGQKISNAHS